MNLSTAIDKETAEILGSKALIKGSLYAAIEHSYAVACWSMPESAQWDIVIDPQPVTLAASKTPRLHSLASGYLIAPFNAGEKKYFIQNRIHIVIGKQTTYHADPGFESALETVKKTGHSKEKALIGNLLPKAASVTVATSENYQASVEAAKKVIQTEGLQKVVLARSKTQPVSVDQLETVVLNLRAQYPLSCIAIHFHPETGLWMSATPELLLSTEADGIFKTVSLAGTQKYDPSVPIRDVSWTHKEIEEQALVSRYIINCFKTIRLREYIEQGPRTIQSGNLLHLKTDFTANARELHMEEIGTTMLQLLHPTSAVCGMPKKPALDFIHKYENFDRKLFSGYSGPVNINKETSLYVTLRCAQIHADAITLYAGAGITSDSVAQREFEETNLKMDVIGKAFSNLYLNC